MPRRPDFSQHRQHPRFDRYRDRVGRLFRGLDEVGLVLVSVTPYAEQCGGRLWWKRWDRSRDVLRVDTMVDGQSSDQLVPDDASEDEMRDYDEGRYGYYGETLRVSGRTATSPVACPPSASSGRPLPTVRARQWTDQPTPSEPP